MNKLEWPSNKRIENIGHNGPTGEHYEMNNLTKRQIKTIVNIGRWADGCCTHSKAKVTINQLISLNLVSIQGDAVILTAQGKGIYRNETN